MIDPLRIPSQIWTIIYAHWIFADTKPSNILWQTKTYRHFLLCMMLFSTTLKHVTKGKRIASQNRPIG
jgi:hypothetical protein